MLEATVPRIADSPVNPQATRGADDDFYRAHPEMVTKDGKRIPIDPCNPQHLKYQSEWMDGYERHHGKTHAGRFTPVCSSPVATCRCEGSLVVVVKIKDGNTEHVVAGAAVRLYGPSETSGETDEAGRFSFSGLESGLHAIDVDAPDGSFGFDTVQIECNQTAEKDMWLKPEIEMKTVAVQWFRETRTSYIRRGVGRGSDLKEKVYSTTIVEKYAKVPKDYKIIESRSNTLEATAGGPWSQEVIKERGTDTYGPKSTGKVEEAINKAINALGLPLSPDEKYGLESSPMKQVYSSWDEAKQNMNPVDFKDIERYR